MTTALARRTPIGVQRRMMELGRIRIGDKKGTGKDPRRKLTKFRLTSASRALLEAAAALYGGSVTEWNDAPDEGYYELYTETNELDVMLPPVFSADDGSPTYPYSQFYELWSAGGCDRRCDGVTEVLSGEACMCDPDNRTCAITTRVSMMLPRLPGLGVWRLDSKGWNAATLLPGTLEVLQQAAEANTFIRATLRIESRTTKRKNAKTGKPETRKFVVPVLDFPVPVDRLLSGELERGDGSVAINAPKPAPPRPALPTAPPPPEDPSFDGETDFGTRPTIPEGLSSEQFAEWVKGAKVNPETFKAVGKELFSGRTPNSLTDVERAQFRDALLEATAQGSFFEQAAEQAQKKKETAKA